MEGRAARVVDFCEAVGPEFDQIRLVYVAIDRLAGFEAMVDAGGGRFCSARDLSSGLAHIVCELGIVRASTAAVQSQEMAVEIDRRVEHLVESCPASRSFATGILNEGLNGAGKANALQCGATQCGEQALAELNQPAVGHLQGTSHASVRQLSQPPRFVRIARVSTTDE